MEFSATIFGDGVDLTRQIMRNHSHVPAAFSVLVISASAILPLDFSGSPRAVVRSEPYHPPSAVPSAPARRMKRIRLQSINEDGGEDSFFVVGNGDDGPFGGGGKGWGSWRSGGSEWEEPDRRPWIFPLADRIFDVVYEVLCWIALSNCAHFAFKKINRFLEEREKDVSIGLVLPRY